MPTIIKNGILVNGEKASHQEILLENGKITSIADTINITNAEIIDARGNYIFPGGIDPHVHMALPSPAGKSSDDFYSGARAALAGGTTTFIDFVTPIRGESLSTAYEKRRAEAKDALVDFSFHMSPVEWRKSTADEIMKCYKNYGITSFKTYMAYKNTVGLNDDALLKVMEAVAQFDGLVTVHAELGDEIQQLRKQFIREGKVAPKYHPLSRPNRMESGAIQKVIDFSKKTNCKVYIVHVSAAESVALIRKAKREGVSIFAETCPHYLLLDDAVYEGKFEETAPYVLSPPIRKKNDQEALWQGIFDGTIDTIGTDHAPFYLNGQKDRGRDDFTQIPNGAGSVEFRLPLLFTYGVLNRKLPIHRFVELTAKNPAKIFGLNTKGELIIGNDADMVIWDAQVASVISAKSQFQNCDSTIYEGFKLRGGPGTVIKNGIIVFNDNKVHGSIEPGKFLYRT